MKSIPEIMIALPQFTGSELWHRWSPLFPKCLLTDGAKYVADSCEAYWLMDAIASHQHDLKVGTEPFQVWHLDRDAGRGTGRRLLWADDGNGKVIARQEIQYSDFPLDSIKLYAVRNEEGGVTIMLPGEY